MAGLLARVRGFFGRAAPQAAPAGDAVPRVGLALGDLPLSHQIQRIGGNLTPEHVSRILRMADAGYPAGLADLGNDARQKDCSLQQALQQRETGLSSLPWKLVIPGESEGSSRGARQKKFVTNILSRKGLLASLVPHLVGAVYNGYAVSEILWVKDDAGRLVPGAFENHPARRFGFRASNGALVWRDQGMDAEGVDFREEFPNRFIVSQPRVNGDVASREGLIRVLMWVSLFRTWSLTDWLKLGEIAWKPWRWAEVQPGTGQKAIDALIAVLEGMIASGVAVLPTSAKLNVAYPGGSGTSGGKPGHAELFEVLGREAVKAIVGQTLTTQEGNKGTQALGKVHNEVRKDIRDADALHVAMVISRDLIAPLVVLNFGASAPMPEFQFITDEGKDLDTFATALSKLVSTGMDVPVEWAHEESGIPAPKEGEAVLKLPSKPGAPPPDGPSGPANEGDDGAEVEPDDAQEAA